MIEMNEELRKKIMRFKRICSIIQTITSDFYFLCHHLVIKIENQITMFNIIRNHLSDPCKIKFKVNDHFTLINPVSDKIITALLESYCGNIYSTMEIFAAIIKKSFLLDKKTQIPTGFHAIIKKINKNELDEVDLDFVKLIKSRIEWYERAREIRTEWTHFSSIFMGSEGGKKVIVLDTLRYSSDKKHYIDKRNLIVIEEILSFLDSMINFIADVGNYLGDKYLIPKLNLAEVQLLPVNHSITGIVIDSKGIKMKEVTIGDFIEKGNVED